MTRDKDITEEKKDIWTKKKKGNDKKYTVKKII